MHIWGMIALTGMGMGGSTGLVDVRAVCPAIRVELRYATTRNGAGRALYPRRARAMLRPAVADRLCRAERRLAARGYGLKVWDAYRPLSAQRALWHAFPNKRFVAPPRRGSKHNRGAAVDVTLVDAHGRNVSMPTDFDAFSGRARPGFRGGTPEQRRHRDILRKAMRAEGFKGDPEEWWHFTSPDWRRYRLLDVPLAR